MARASQETVERILDGALRALARRGLRRVSMSDICAEAGVSRGTLYRYFKSKEEVFEAISSHVEYSFREGMQRAVAERPELEHRLVVVFDAIAHQGVASPQSVQIIEDEPGFALDFLRRELSVHRQIVAEALAPLAARLVCVRDGDVSELDFAEMVLRLSMSAFLVPSEHGRSLPPWAPTMLRFLPTEPDDRRSPVPAGHMDA